jgi:hypothetical protein
MMIDTINRFAVALKGEEVVILGFLDRRRAVGQSIGLSTEALRAAVLSREDALNLIAYVATLLDLDADEIERHRAAIKAT